MYSPLLKNGGWIGFHDIKERPLDHWIQVDKFWKTIKEKFTYLEFIDNSTTTGGIGVLKLEKND